MDKYFKSFKKLILNFSENKYGTERARELLKETERIYGKFVAETPDIGYKGNPMAHNLYQSLVFFAFYEATGRSLTEEDINTLANSLFADKQWIGKVIDINKLDKAPFRAILHGYFRRLSKKTEKNRDKWHNTWGIEVNPENHKTGFAMTLVGCPIADFAREHGYLDIMPHLCNTDNTSTELMHGKLIRHNTVAQGADKCDYWIVGDKSEI